VSLWGKAAGGGHEGSMAEQTGRAGGAPEVTLRARSAPRSLWDRRPVKTLIWLLIIAAVIQVYRGAEYLVTHVFSVLLLFIFATVIALILTPAVDWMQRVRPFRGHRGLAVLTLYIGGIALVAGAIAAVTPSLVAQAKQLPMLMTQVQAELDHRGLPFQLNSLSKAVSGEQVAVALGVVAAVVSGVVNVVLVVVISIYLLIEGRVIVATARNLFPKREKEFDFVAVAVGSTVAAYVRGQLVLSVTIGTYTGITLTLIGVKYGLVIGVAAFFLEFIPIVGAAVAMVVAVLVALLQSPLLGLLAGIVGLLGHALEAYVVGPRIAGRVTQLHALVAMAALLVGAELGGILGAVFAVPIAAVGNIFLGAAYRARQGEKAMSTADHGEVSVDALPRLGEEVGVVEEEGVAGAPVPRTAGTKD